MVFCLEQLFCVWGVMSNIFINPTGPFDPPDDLFPPFPFPVPFPPFPFPVPFPPVPLPDPLAGTSDNDTLFAGSGDDLIYGLEGNDSIDGGSGTDIISGGKGDDTISGDSDNIEIEIEISKEPKLIIKGTLGDFRDLFRDIGDSISEFIDEAQDAINNAIDDAQNAINDAIDDAQDAINDAIDGVQDLFSDNEDVNSVTTLSNVSRDNLSNIQVINDLFNNIVLSIENLSQILQDNGLNVIDEQLTNSFLETLTSFQADFISGGAGNDLLIGGVGADTFQFEDITPGEIDTITDFTPDVDKIRFTSSETLFEEGSLIYNIETGIVSYDPDGIANNGDELDFLQIGEDLDIDIDDFEFL